MMRDYSYAYEWDQEYCYPNSNVLINKGHPIGCPFCCISENHSLNEWFQKAYGDE